MTQRKQALLVTFMLPVVVVVIGLAFPRPQLRPPMRLLPQWTVEQAYSLEDVTAILNRLPLMAAETAHVVISNSPREIFVWHYRISQ